VQRSHTYTPGFAPTPRDRIGRYTNARSKFRQMQAQGRARRDAAQAKRPEQTHARLWCIALFFGCCFAALGLRLVEVTFVGGGDLPFKRLVSEPHLLLEHEGEVGTARAPLMRPLRREITDRNGMVIATSVATASLVANPTLIRHESETAAALSRIFPDQKAAALLARLKDKHSKFVYIKRHLKPAEQEAVNNLGVPGLFFEPDTRRVYPYGGLFAHAIGYVGVDNQGLAGIEQYYDRTLSDPVRGEKPLALSLDLRVQAMLREEMQQTIRQFSAIGGVGVVYDVQKGEILGLSSLPEFNPNHPASAVPESRFNRASLGAYEMGSTFKTFTVAAALEQGTASLSGGYDATRPIRSGGFTISDSHPKARWLTTPEIFAYSSNIGTVRMAMQLGTERQQQFLRAIGMMSPVSVELPERSKPLLPKQWGQLTTMTVSFGHGISVSPLHVVQGIASVVTGHKAAMTLVKNGNAKKPKGTRILSEKTTEQMRALMRLVVADGTARAADAKGYRVGGKTGTAEKTVGGRYMRDAKLASFVGAFPMEDPRYVVLIMIDEPKGTKATFGYATGGWVAAPAVGRLVQRMAPMLGMNPDFEKTEPLATALAADMELREKQARLAKQAGGVHAASF
jgi:cell division protein FtsI (penicillin-binding protein 3)